MRYITDDVYKRMQLFQLPMDGDVSLGDLEEWGMDLDDFFRQELLAKDEWYLKYTPERLKNLLFDREGEVIFTELTEEIISLSRQFRQDVETQWAGILRQLQLEREKIRQAGASADLLAFLDTDFHDGAIRAVHGLDTQEVTLEVMVGWDGSELVTLTFTGVRESWMGRVHKEDPNWWLFEEIFLNAKGRYEINVLFDNADYIGQLQLVFTDLKMERQLLG